MNRRSPFVCRDDYIAVSVNSQTTKKQSRAKTQSHDLRMPKVLTLRLGAFARVILFTAS